MTKPTILKGNHHQDERGIIKFNNDFNAFGIKRVYTIKNVDEDFIRSWQGHQIEQRWFSAILGSFKIKLIAPDHWETPAKNLPILEFILTANNLNVLHIPPGFISSIQATEKNSTLLVFADYELGALKDEYRFPTNYFD